MILAGQLLLDDTEGGCYLSPGHVRVEDGEIAEVVEGEIPETADAGDRSTLITPGFIDAHLHLPQFDIIGAHGRPLLSWLSDFAFPAEMRWADPEFARGMMQRVASQLLSVGTTGVCGFATVHDQSTRAAIDELQAAGMRGVVGQVLMDREAPAELCRPERQLLDSAERLAQEFPVTGRLSTAITPRFAVSCSASLLAGAASIAERHKLWVQTHLAETSDEVDLVRRMFGTRAYLDVYRNAGLLGDRTVLAHGIHLDQEDLDTLHASGSIIAHCPTANSFLLSGVMDRQQLIDSDVAVVLGSDIGAGYERSMVRVARAMIEAAASLGDRFPDAATAWHTITAGNADRLGWSDAGRIRVGCSADLLVVRPDVAWLDADFDPLSMLMFAWDDRWIERTLLQGRFRWP